MSVLCLPALACGGHDDDGGSGGSSTSGGGVAASGGGIIGGSTSDGSTSDGSASDGAASEGSTSDGDTAGGGGDDGGGKVPTSPLHIPAINYKGRPFDAVTDFGRQTWELIQNDVRTACEDGTVCLRLERVYSTDLPASETETVEECGFVKIAPVAGTQVDRDSPLTIIGLGPCLGGTPGGGSPPESPPPGSPSPESPSPAGSPPVSPSTSTP
ncbi:hypothetical protein [Streptomyces sp. NPDC029674]|uniref:hypothetical protein n=1 Tax=Streptomyces sp. NPDC029674 TaxID=3365297 RepID=UPI00384ED524